MTAQIPNGDPTLYCPFWKKTLDKVCRTCPLFKQVRGRDVNTGENVDRWDCSLSWLPMLMLEVANQSRSHAAATEDFRNQVVSISLAQLNHDMVERAPVKPPITINQQAHKMIEN